MPRIFVIFIFFLLSSLGNCVLAQSSQESYYDQNIELRKFDDVKYDSLTKGVDFNEIKKEKKRKVEKKETPIKFDGIGPAFKFFIIAMGIGLLVFFLIKALNSDSAFLPKDKKLNPVSGIDLQNIEDNLEDMEMDDPIRQAIAAGAFPLAVRLYYLSVLKELSSQKKITWKKDKTNGEYLREMAGTPYFGNMQKITLAFEKIWYGKVDLKEKDFRMIEPGFVNLLGEIKKTEGGSGKR